MICIRDDLYCTFEKKMKKLTEDDLKDKLEKLNLFLEEEEEAALEALLDFEMKDLLEKVAKRGKKNDHVEEQEENENFRNIRRAKRHSRLLDDQGTGFLRRGSLNMKTFKTDF